MQSDNTSFGGAGGSPAEHRNGRDCTTAGGPEVETVVMQKML